MGESSQPGPKRRSRAQPWPYSAAQVADELAATLTANIADFDTIRISSEAIDRLADTCLQQIANGNILLVQRILLDLRNIAIGQKDTCANGKNRSGTARAQLAAARVGEYGGEG